MSDLAINRYTADGVDGATLTQLVGMGKWRWAYVERPSGTELTWFAVLADENEPWPSWHHARLFNERAELAWWQEYDGLFTCRLLASDPPTSPVWQQGGRYKPLNLMEKQWQPEATLLHGRWNGNTDPPTWSEPRVPRYLAYPVPTDAELKTETRGVLHTAVYRGNDADDVLTRYVSVGVWTPTTGGAA